MNKSAKVWMPIAALSLFAAFLILKNTLLGLETDEQYAVFLTNKILNGNTLFKDCFEIHQTAALIPALFLKLKHTVFDATGDIIFLRICSFLLLLLAGISIYVAAVKSHSKAIAFTSALFVTTFLPKYSLAMDYALLQYVFLTLMMSLFLKNSDKPYNEWNNKDYVMMGIFCGLLTFSYPPFIIYPLTLAVCFKKQSIKIYLSALPTAFLFFVATGGVSFMDIGKIFGDASHSEPIISKLYSNLSASWQIAVIVLYFLFLLTVSKGKTEEKNHFVIAFLLFAICITIIEVFGKHHKMGYNGAWLLLLAIIISYAKKVPTYISLGSSILLMQFLSGNQTGLLFARYAVPFIVALLLQSKISESLKRGLLMTMLLLSLLPITYVTANFQNRQTYFSKVSNGSAIGISVDEMTEGKMKEVADFYNGKSGKILILDSSAILYESSNLTMHCPDLIDTATFDSRFISYFEENGYPDYIYYVPLKNAIKLSDSFKQMIKEKYETTDTLGYGYCLSRR